MTDNEKHKKPVKPLGDGHATSEPQTQDGHATSEPQTRDGHATSEPTE